MKFIVLWTNTGPHKSQTATIMNSDHLFTWSVVTDICKTLGHPKDFEQLTESEL